MSASDDRSAVRERLRSMFDVDFKQHGQRWDALWQSADLPFDRGVPNPALVDTLSQKSEILGPPSVTRPNGELRRKRALVPGCGRGYDVLLLACHGYDAYGLEVSREAVKACNEFAKANLSAYCERVPGQARGQYSFLHGDFFADDWLQWVKGQDLGFDLIYDYTFLSALPPQTRPAWSKRMSDLLTSNGRLICVEFPTYKDPESGGPPFALPSDVYLAHLTKPGDVLPYESGLPKQDSYQETNDLTLERVAHWQPERTHDIGKGTDWVSIWERI